MPWFRAASCSSSTLIPITGIVSRAAAPAMKQLVLRDRLRHAGRRLRVVLLEPACRLVLGIEPLVALALAAPLDALPVHRAAASVASWRLVVSPYSQRETPSS